MKDLNVSVLQIPLFWENPKKNRDQIEEFISSADVNSDLFVLPEMFTTGFSMDAETAGEADSGRVTLEWMKSLAAKHDAAICGSIAIEEGGNFYNRLYWVNPNGDSYSYDKRHLFTFHDEDKSYEPGSKRLIVEYKGWKFCPLICYDLRFPVFSRNSLNTAGTPAYDALIYVANWPAVRRDPWIKLLHARSIENQCYTIGANRVGSDENDIQYSGDSYVIDPKGMPILSPENKAGVFSTTLSAIELEAFRKKFPVLADADRFTIQD